MKSIFTMLANFGLFQDRAFALAMFTDLFEGSRPRVIQVPDFQKTRLQTIGDQYRKIAPRIFDATFDFFDAQSWLRLNRSQKVLEEIDQALDLITIARTSEPILEMKPESGTIIRSSVLIHIRDMLYGKINVPTAGGAHDNIKFEQRLWSRIRFSPDFVKVKQLRYLLTFLFNNKALMLAEQPIFGVKTMDFLASLIIDIEMVEKLGDIDRLFNPLQKSEIKLLKEDLQIQIIRLASLALQHQQPFSKRAEEVMINMVQQKAIPSDVRWMLIQTLTRPIKRLEKDTEDFIQAAIANVFIVQSNERDFYNATVDLWNLYKIRFSIQ